MITRMKKYKKSTWEESEAFSLMDRISRLKIKPL